MKVMMSLPKKPFSYQKSHHQIFLIPQNIQEKCQDDNKKFWDVSFLGTFLKNTHAYRKIV